MPGTAAPGSGRADGAAPARAPDVAGLPRPARVLVLGGTAEGRRLATMVDEAGMDVVSALAGSVAQPRLPSGEVRVGGFGGASGLTAYLRERAVRAVVDATHPFATRISASAAAACAAAGVPLALLRRPGWHERPGDRWRRVADLAEAAAALPDFGGRVLLTVGRQGLAAFAGVGALWFLIRCIETPRGPLPPRREVLLARGPFTVEDEEALLRMQRIDVLVTRDSGGAATAAKLEAARALRIPVVMVERPPPTDVPTVADVDAAMAWLRAAMTPPPAP